MRLKHFWVLGLMGLWSTVLPAEGVILGKYGKSPQAYVEVLGKKENNFSFIVDVSANDGACAFQGTAKLIDSSRASAIFNDCFLVFVFDKNYQQLTLSSKACDKTCKGNAQNLLDGVYSK